MTQVLLLIGIPQTNHIPRRIPQCSYLDTIPFEPGHYVHCYIFQHLLTGYDSSHISDLKLDIPLLFILFFSYMKLQDYFSFDGLLMNFTKLVV